MCPSSLGVKGVKI